MKRFITIMFSFLIMFFGGMFISSNLAFAEEENVFEINSPEKYVEVMSNDDAYLEGAKVVLKADIDLESQDLSQIYSTNRIFKGVFDGNGYTISNVNIGGYGSYFGLIPRAENATIQNLKLQKNVAFDFGESNLQVVYAGILVGYGEDVTIKNCELDGDTGTTTNTDDPIRLTVTIPTKSDVYFGSIAGKLTGQIPNLTQCTSRIFDCINYYNLSLEMTKKGFVYAGGIVGQLNNASLERVINFGNINLKGIAIAENDTSQYLGGLVGSVTGGSDSIKNSLSGGNVTFSNATSLDKKYNGGIIGGNTGSAKSSKFNYDYYKIASLTPSGDSFLTQSKYLCFKDFTSHEFLNDQSNFDGAVASWDFDKTWSLNFHLQNFQTFSFVLNNVIDKGGIFAKAYFVYDGKTSQEVSGEQDTGSVEIKTKYGQRITICLEMKEEYKGWYILKASGVNLNGNNSDLDEITISEPEMGNYNIEFNASLLTSGADYKGYYSFTAEAEKFEGIISLSQEAKNGNQGIYRIARGEPRTEEKQWLFSYRERSIRVSAEGNEQFIFDHWEILYKNAQGQYSQENKYEENIGDQELLITYGEAPFDKEFMCVGYFTDSGAIKVSFGNVGTGEYAGIKSIKFSGKDYDGVEVKEILVSPTNPSISLQVVTKNGYKIRTDEFKKDIEELYGGNNTFTIAEDAVTIDEETGEKTYNFVIDMSLITTNSSLQNNSLKLSFVVEREAGGGGNTLLWLYITLPIAVLLIVGIIVFILLRRRRKMAALDDDNDSSRSGSQKQKVSKPKKDNYKNYY